MIHIVGASCLSRAFGQLDKKQKTSLTSKITAIPSLSLNPNVNFQLKSLQFLLNNGSLGSKNNLVLWHDIINDSLTKHKSNGYTALHPKALVEILESNKSRISAILYCHRTGAPDIFSTLRQIDIPIIRVTKNLVSKKKQQCVSLLLEYSKIHPHYYLELKSLSIVLRYSRNLQALSKNTRRDNRKLSQRKRRLLKKRNRLRSVH